MRDSQDYVHVMSAPRSSLDNVNAILICSVQAWTMGWQVPRLHRLSVQAAESMHFKTNISRCINDNGDVPFKFNYVKWLPYITGDRWQRAPSREANGGEGGGGWSSIDRISRAAEPGQPYRPNFLRTQLMNYSCIHLQASRHSVTLIVHNAQLSYRGGYITNYTLLRAWFPHGRKIEEIYQKAPPTRVISAIKVYHPLLLLSIRPPFFCAVKDAGREIQKGG